MDGPHSPNPNGSVVVFVGVVFVVVIVVVCVVVVVVVVGVIVVFVLAALGTTTKTKRTTTRMMKKTTRMRTTTTTTTTRERGGDKKGVGNQHNYFWGILVEGSELQSRWGCFCWRNEITNLVLTRLGCLSALLPVHPTADLPWLSMQRSATRR
jgi:predicted metalloprotease